MSEATPPTYTTRMEGTEVEGAGPIHRSAISPTTLLAVPDAETDTMFKLFQRGKASSRDGRCLGTRQVNADGSLGEYGFMTYNEVEQAAHRFASGLIAMQAVVPLRVAPSDPNTVAGKHMVGLFSSNRKEWVIAAEACNAYSLVSVPLYDTLGDEGLAYIANQTALTVIVCSGSLLSKACALDTPSLKVIVCMDAIGEEARQVADQKGRSLYHFDEVLKRGFDEPSAVVPPSPSHLATICYTSGTTGNPKGVMILHKNLVADLTGAIQQGFALNADDVYLSYLPLAHMFERLVVACVMYFGGRVYFFSGTVQALMGDIATVRPTLFASVPRLLNRVYDKVMSKVRSSGGMKKKLFNCAVNAKMYYLKRNDITHKFWDSLVFKKIRANLGGRVRLLVSGSAPISHDVLDFLRIALSCPCIEGYGQTETSAAATVAFPWDMSTSGHVGGPMVCVEMRLVDVPEMGYLSSNDPPRGEVCYRGPCITPGYFKEPDKTREAIDEDGWLHSGDIGEWLPNGALKIIDRKKNIFKLAQGEYVAAEKIENAYAKSPLIAQSFVYGDSYQSCLVGVVVPDFEEVRKMLTNEGKTTLASGSVQQIAADDGVKGMIMKDMKRVEGEVGLKGFEKVKDIVLESEEFSVQNGLLTPSFKLKRPQAREQYKPQIDEMYTRLNTLPTAAK